MVINEKQQRQEEGYAFPYHWLKQPDTTDGRMYFGYLSMCAEVLEGKDTKTAILDAGCGDARFLKVVQEKGFTNLSGLDYSERAIAFARLLMPDVQFLVEDLTASTDTGTFDVIFFIETLEHIEPSLIPVVLQGLRRRLKSGGKLVVTVPSLYGGAPHPESKHYQHFTVESLTQCLESAFRVERMRRQDYIPAHPLKLAYRMLENPWWDIKPLRRWYNQHVWPKNFNECDPRKARRLWAECVAR